MKIKIIPFCLYVLKELNIINKTHSLIADRGKTPPDLHRIDLNDPDTYRLIAEGDTTGIFQFESAGEKNFMKKLKPNCFEDVVLAHGIYRFGPIENGMVDDFLDRRHGRKEIRYIVPELEPILKDTYGLIVYGEQVVKIAVELAGYSIADADNLRKDLVKKIVERIDKQRVKFVQKAEIKGIKRDKAVRVFDLLNEYAGFTFNKTYSVGYAQISYHMAYLKAHFIDEFMEALATGFC